MRGEENSLGWYVRSSTEPFLIGVKLAGIVKADMYTSKEEFNKSGVGKKTAELKEKVMRGQFLRQLVPKTFRARKASYQTATR